MTSLLLVLTLAAPPQFTVENHCPATFTVVNLCPAAAPAVAPKIPFHSGHDCPTCGRIQYRVYSGVANVAGHTHRCPYDGTIWRH